MAFIRTGLTILAAVTYSSGTFGYPPPTCCSGTFEFPVQTDSGAGSWTGKEADIYFLLNPPTWIGDCCTMLRDVAGLVSRMDIGPNATRVGVGVFSSDHHQHIPLNNQYNKTSLIAKIGEAKHLKGETLISHALNGLLYEGLSPNVTRYGVPLIAVLITDDAPRHRQISAEYATETKKRGIFLFTVGVGVSADELRILASDPKQDYAYSVQDFEQLKNIMGPLSSIMSQIEFPQGDGGKCNKNTWTDTVFVFDESGLGDTATKRVQEFIMKVVDNLDLNSGRDRVAVFSKTCNSGEIHLGDHVKEETFNSALVQQNGPDISSLVKQALTTGFDLDNGARSYSKKRLVVIMHAKTTDPTTLKFQMYRAKFMGRTTTYIIRLGSDYDKSLLNAIVSNPEDILYLESAHLLPLPDNVSKFSSTLCKDL